MRWYETKFCKKPKVLDQEKLCGILWTFIKFREIVFPTFVYFHKSYKNSVNIRQHLTVFPSDFNNIYLKYFGILQNLTRNYEILWKFAKVNESYNIPHYFLGQITHFRSVSFNCNELLAFRDKQNFSVCYHTILPLGITIVKRKVIFPISQILRSGVRISPLTPGGRKWCKKL